MGITRHDIRYLVSAMLLVTAVFTASMGLVSEIWDLNDFVFHKYAAYALIAVGGLHVALHWRRLLGYARWRLYGRKRGRFPSSAPEIRRPPAERPAVPAPDKVRDLGWGRVPLTRRAFLGMLASAAGGFALGRLWDQGADLPYGGDVGAIYHQWSKPRLLSVLGAVADWGSRPPGYKEYPQVARIALPVPQAFAGIPTEECIRRRRSVRDYTAQPIALHELSRLIYLTGGVTGERWGHKLRAAPSAGALYPIEIYPVIHWVEGLAPGLYHYAVREHALERLREGDLRAAIVRLGLMQEFLGQANLVLVFTAIFQRLRWRYRERSYRYALLEAGHLGQNVYLAAVSMGLGACAVGAFIDDELNSLLGVDGEQEAALYMLAVGKI